MNPRPVTLKLCVLAVTPAGKTSDPHFVAQHAIENAGNKVLTFVIVAGIAEIVVLLAVSCFAFRIWPALRGWKKEVLGLAGAAGGVIGVVVGGRISGLF